MQQIRSREPAAAWFAPNPSPPADDPLTLEARTHRAMCDTMKFLIAEKFPAAGSTSGSGTELGHDDG